MEPRTRILFISYIIIVIAIVAIGVVPYIVKGDYKKPVPAAPVGLEKAADEQVLGEEITLEPSAATAEKKTSADTKQYVSTIHVIDTNKLTKSVRFQIPTDGVYFEEQNAHLYEIMKDKKGRDIRLSYQKLSKNNEVYYNFKHSAEIR
ncbi:MAG: hypothetical protein IJS09_05815 [Treponema sp.]|nr:hypothetical protein [Treponema sp.]